MFYGEIQPELMPEKIMSRKFTESKVNLVSEKLVELKNHMQEEATENNKKMSFRYDYNSTKIKTEINDLSKLILNVSKDCRNEFRKYVANYVEMEKIYSKYNLDKKQDEIKVTTVAKDEMYKMMGNQILQFLKESVMEVNSEKKEEYKQRQEAYQSRKETLSELRAERNEQLKQNYETKKLMNSLAKRNECCQHITFK